MVPCMMVYRGNNKSYPLIPVNRLFVILTKIGEFPIQQTLEDLVDFSAY